MEELRWAFLVLGGCAIVAILAHGIWSVRKSSRNGQQEYQPNDQLEEAYEQEDEPHANADIRTDIQIDTDDPLLEQTDMDRTSAAYDALGIGSVRVVSSAENTVADEDEPEQALSAEDPPSFEVTEQVSEDSHEPQDEQVTVDAEPAGRVTPVPDIQLESEPKPKMYASVVTQPKPEYVAEQQARERKQDGWAAPTDVPEPPVSLLKEQQAPETVEPQKAEKVQAVEHRKEPSFNLEQTELKAPEKTKVTEKISLAEQARNLVSGKKVTRKRKPQTADDEQMRIDFDEPATETQSADAEGGGIEQEVLVLNVKASADNSIPGSAMLPMLLTLGFKFGEQNIFHRHVNANGKGPVLFSLANMFKPGHFDIDNLENFSTQGVSLFMILPIEGDPHQVFNMMHNAARKIADEFSAQVLDGRRSALTKQSLQQYVEKIREFERKRRINR